MNCPTCTAQLRAIRYEGVTIHTCDGCGGEFVGPAEMRHIVAIREEVFSPELLAMLENRKPAFGMPGEATPLTCPACAGSMRSLNYAVDTGIAVDRCQSCSGIWLDEHELEKIQALLERWHEQAPAQLAAAAEGLVLAQSELERTTKGAFRGSRFAFMNAVMNRLLDAA